MAVAVSPDQQADSFIHRQHKLLIDGEWVAAASGETFATINPATEETLAEVAHGQAEDIERAVRAARNAFDGDSPWRRMNASGRGRMIWRIADLIEEHGDELAMLESLDNGKPYGVARAADIPLAADLFRYMAGWPTKIEGSTIPISALPAHLQGPSHGQAPARGNGVDQHLPRVRRGDAVRRLQGVRLGTRDGLAGPQQLPRDEVGRHR
jgi:Aldehyde dehydrogenase family